MKRGGAPAGGGVLLALGALTAIAFWVVGAVWFDGWALGLGSTLAPTWHHFVFLVFFTLFGSVTAALLARGLRRALPDMGALRPLSDRTFLVWATALGLLVPLALRVFVLHGADITDDESLYRFAATLLAQGHVTAPSHPWRLFFDHAGVVNGGRMYTQYFLGWPAFLGVGVLLGMPSLVNPVLSALTVPALYLLARRLVSRGWAQAVVLVFLLSPMLQLLAATELAHTSELFCLAWAAWLAFEAVDRPAARWPATLLAVAFSAAFFTRPLTALGIGGPFVALWVVGWWRGGRPAASAVAFVLPAALMGGLFLAVNAAQSGSPWTPAYLAWHAYAVRDGYRFSGLDPAAPPHMPNLVFTGILPMARTWLIGVMRMNFALLGWPTAFFFLPLALGARGSRVLWASLALFLLLCLPLHDPGIDTVGPVHFAGLALPVLLLTGVGLSAWTDRRRARGDAFAAGTPLAVLAAVLLCDVLLYSPARIGTVSEVARLAGAPARLLREHDVRNAVVFATVPYARACEPGAAVPSVPFVRWWPLNRPDFSNPVVQANHLSVARDRELVGRYFAGRTGWILHWTRDCTLHLVPLASADPKAIPNGIMIFSSRGVVRYAGEDPSGAIPRTTR